MARVVWNSLAQARSVDLQIKENTITDFLLLKLKRDYPDLLSIRDFSTREEARAGADWEWWFTEQGPRPIWLGFRVQAKIVNFKTNAFEHLHYDKGSQCTKLLQNASTDGFPRIPIYCLYHQYLDSGMLATCSSIAGKAGYKTLGVSLVPAATVQATYARRGSSASNSLNDLTPDVRPWHQLVCNMHRVSHPSLPELVMSNWRSFAVSVDRVTPGSGEGQYIIEKPPSYVENMMDWEGTVELPSGIERVTVIQGLANVAR